MSWFKRLCLFVFGVSGMLALAALSLTWVGPWTTQLRGMLELRWFFITLEVLVCISGVGLLVCVLMSLFAPRNPKETIVADVDSGKITITRTAIVSQTKHVIEADGTCIASSVGVTVRKRGHVRVHARVKPRRPIDVVRCGEELYAALQEGLAYVCGDTVESIDIVFLEPEHIDDSLVRVESEPHASRESAPAQSITVPMGGATGVTPEKDEPVQKPEDEAEPTVEIEPVVDTALLVVEDEEPALVEQEEPALQEEAEAIATESVALDEAEGEV